MASEVSSLVLAVDSRQVRAATTELQKFGSQGKRTETAVQGVQRSFVSLRGALGGISAGLAVRAIIQAADGYKSLNARLQLVTKSATEFAAAQKSVFDIAQRTRTSLESTGDLFSTLSRSSDALGATQDQVAKVTETIQKSFAVSGTSAAAAAGAVTQLNQAFASGVLRGEEFNSVSEQAAILMDVLGRSLGKSRGELRQLSEDGKLTSDVVFKALLQGGDEVNRLFNGLPLTVGGATTQVSTALTKLIGVIDSSTGATQGLADAIGSAATIIGNFADELERLRGGDQSVGDLAKAFQFVSQQVQLLNVNSSGLLASIVRDGKLALAALYAVAEVMSKPPENLIESARTAWGRFDAISSAIRADGERAERELQGVRNRILGLTRESTAGSENDARRGRGFNFGAGSINAPITLPAKKTTTRGGGAKRETVSEADRYLESLRKQLQATNDLSVAETVLADIQAGRLGKVTATQQDSLLSIARQIDAANEFEAALKAEDERAESVFQKRKAIADEAQRSFEATRTPLELLNIELAKQQRLLDELGPAYFDTYERATNAAQDTYEATIKLNEETTKGKNVAEELGLTFSSAFEDAIVKGGSLRDLLKGLEGDILRIVTRQLVTKPLAGYITNFIGGLGSVGGGGFLSNFFSSLFGGARARGGDIQRGSVYEINEGGVGEIANVGGRQYLLAAQNGSIERNARQGNTINATINVNMPAGASAATGQQFGARIARELQRASTRGN